MDVGTVSEFVAPGDDITGLSFSYNQSFSSYPAAYMESTTTGQRPAKQLKTTDSWSSYMIVTGTDHSNQHIATPPEACSPSNFIISFSRNGHNSLTDHTLLASQFCGNVVDNVNPKPKMVSPRNKNTVFASDVSYMNHVVVERKRRHKLNQRFIALSSVVPGLKKMDKFSVLEDAIKYLKQLQEKVKTLETVESVVFVKKTKVCADDNDSSSSNENSDAESTYDEPLPEIEARVSDKNVLIRIHCKKREGVLTKILTQIEKLHLSIISSNAIPFDDSSLAITVTAQMNDEYSMTLKDLVKSLRLSYLKGIMYFNNQPHCLCTTHSNF
ncbi:transcription factor bHLH18-like [Papaver somniferum]|uniref:transcription factor bHLH18-like n=1 Tax=Papaver somniferum TaxID=3469 RepID=UPI000E703044|nr:transcription factor bHLH18-like [Papaver somniferum]